jgi:putative intracellular protease/amidase
MSKGKIVILGSNATRIEVQGAGGTGATGQYLNETVVPAMAFLDAGYEVVLATPTGARPHIDPASDAVQHFDDEAGYRAARAFYAEDPSMQARTLRSVIDEGLDAYAAVFVPGGQAPVVDLMQDAEVGQILRHFHERGKPTAFLCHGPMAGVAAMPNARQLRAALIAGENAKARELARGWKYAGYRMTVFSATEEKVIEDDILHARLYFNMPDALRAAGGEVSIEPVDFTPHVVEDRELITGQNPRSDKPLAARLIQALTRVALPV